MHFQMFHSQVPSSLLFQSGKKVRTSEDETIIKVHEKWFPGIPINFTCFVTFSNFWFTITKCGLWFVFKKCTTSSWSGGREENVWCKVLVKFKTRSNNTSNSVNVLALDKHQVKCTVTLLSDLWPRVKGKKKSNLRLLQLAKAIMSICWPWTDIQNCLQWPLCPLYSYEVKGWRKVKILNKLK